MTIVEEEEFYTWFAEHYKTQHFSFPELAPLDGIVFERLTQQNAQALYLLFQNDASPFVDERFKNAAGATKYAKHSALCGPYSPKHGGADWLFRFNDGDYIGILHLYDLSLETWAQNHKRAWIGFATKNEYRRTGITAKVVGHLIQTIFNYYLQLDFIHAMTNKNNTATANFLRKCGFLFDSAERLSKDNDFFLFTRPTLS